jgi:hypothetical protein
LDLAEFVPHLSGIMVEAVIVTDVFLMLEIITEKLLFLASNRTYRKYTRTELRVATKML